jgi:hypothetical protein|tara:strand:+ start:2039 stop:2749 length:711 start_codon:yes stop_codon:yes gene_type:complete
MPHPPEDGETRLSLIQKLANAGFILTSRPVLYSPPIVMGEIVEAEPPYVRMSTAYANSPEFYHINNLSTNDIGAQGSATGNQFVTDVYTCLRIFEGADETEKQVLKSFTDADGEQLVTKGLKKAAKKHGFVTLTGEADIAAYKSALVQDTLQRSYDRVSLFGSFLLNTIRGAAFKYYKNELNHAIKEYLTGDSDVTLSRGRTLSNLEALLVDVIEDIEGGSEEGDLINALRDQLGS